MIWRTTPLRPAAGRGAIVVVIVGLLGAVTAPVSASRTTTPMTAPGCQGAPVDDILGDLCPDEEEPETFDVTVSGDLGGAVVSIVPNGYPACDNNFAEECFDGVNVEIAAGGELCSFIDSYDEGSDRPAGYQGRANTGCEASYVGGVDPWSHLIYTDKPNFWYYAKLSHAGCHAAYSAKPWNDPDHWRFRGEEALTCELARSDGVPGVDSRPNGLYGPTWVLGTVELSVRGTPYTDRRTESAEIWIPVDGDERDRKPVARVAEPEWDFSGGFGLVTLSDDSSSQWGRALDYDWTFEVIDAGQTQDQYRPYATSSEENPMIVFTEGDYYRAALTVTDLANGLTATTETGGSTRIPASWTPMCPSGPVICKPPEGGGGPGGGESVVTLSATDDSASEAGLDPGAWTLERTDATGELTVNVTASGTATPGADYEALPATVTFADGEETAEVALTPVDDTLHEPVETVTLRLAEGDGYTIGDPSTGEIALHSDDAPGAVATAITAGPVTQVYGRAAKLAVTVAPNATGAVTVTVGSQNVTGTLAGGRVTLTLPAAALAPGSRRASITYAGVPGTFQPSAGQATVQVVKAAPTVRVTKVRATVKRGKKAVFRIAVAAPGVKPGGKVRVKLSGKTKTAKLNKNGQVTVRIRLARKIKPGKKKVRVVYLGDGYVAKGKATATKIKVR